MTVALSTGSSSRWPILEMNAEKLSVNGAASNKRAQAGSASDKPSPTTKRRET